MRFLKWRKKKLATMWASTSLRPFWELSQRKAVCSRLTSKCSTSSWSEWSSDITFKICPQYAPWLQQGSTANKKSTTSKFRDNYWNSLRKDSICDLLSHWFYTPHYQKNNIFKDPELTKLLQKKCFYWKIFCWPSSWFYLYNLMTLKPSPSQNLSDRSFITQGN